MFNGLQRKRHRTQICNDTEITIYAGQCGMMFSAEIQGYYLVNLEITI